MWMILFFQIFCKQYIYLCQSYIIEHKFDNSLLENYTEFIPDTVTNANIAGNADMLKWVVETIVFRYMNIMMNNSQICSLNIQFKVQVAFKCLFKKPKKSYNIDGAPFYDGTFEYLTFTKESMFIEDGIILRFSELLMTFRCTYNTTIETINNYLDTRNMPNMDSV